MVAKIRRLGELAMSAITSPKMVWVFLMLGAVRTLLLFLAYPPAQGADGFDYYIYAMRLDGYDHLAGISRHVSPLYPYLLHIAYNIFGSAYVAIGLQVIMAVTITPIYYLAIRPFSPVLAVLASVVILLDAQFHIVFNFLATESLYVFLMAGLVLCLLWGAHYASQEQRSLANWGFVVAGVLFVLLFLTRPTAKLLFIPGILLVFVLTRSWQYMLRAAAGVFGGFVGFAILSTLMIGQVEGLSSGFAMVSNATAKLSGGETRTLSPEGNKTFLPFVTTQLGIVVRDLPQFLVVTGRGILDYTALSARQLGIDPERPSTVQCRGYPYTTPADGWAVNVDTLEQDYMLPSTEQVAETLTQLLPDFQNALCPPSLHSDPLRAVTDYVALRYRSLGRPHRQIPIWYGTVILLVAFVPVLRRFRAVVLVMGTLLLYHAFVSAAVMNIQPRYVVVVNPMRAVLLVMVPFLLAYWAYHRIRNRRSHSE